MRWFLMSLLLVFAATEGLRAQTESPRVFDVCPTQDWDGDCERLILEDIDPQGREIWLRTTYAQDRFTLFEDQPLGIYIWAMGASEIYWNGTLLDTNGEPGASPDLERPGLMDWILFLPQERIREGDNELIVHMSSHHNLTNVIRPIHVIGIGPYTDARGLRLLYYFPALITAGGLLLAAIYFGVSFALNRKNLGALFLATMSLSVVGQLFAELMRGLIEYPYPWHVPRLMAIAAFALGFAVSLVAYVTWRFDRQWLLKTVSSTAAVGLLAIFLAPAFDLKAVAPILIGAVLSLAIVAAKADRSAPRDVVIGGAIALFVLLIFVRQDLFLDRDFYFAAFVLAGILFIGELRTQQSDRVERAKALSRAKELEVELLRRQISPHFLMNTLNTLTAWVEQDPKKGIDIIETLADEYRAVDQLSLRKLVPLPEEVDLCRSHLKLLSYRAEHDFVLVVEGKGNGILIPPTILLTLIENAFSHNVYDEDTTITLSIRGEADAWQLDLRSPLGKQKQSGTDSGLGRSYIEARLVDGFGQGTFQFDEEAKEGFWVSRLVIPDAHG